jgi:hypothetical protein
MLSASGSGSQVLPLILLQRCRRAKSQLHTPANGKCALSEPDQRQHSPPRDQMPNVSVHEGGPVDSTSFTEDNDLVQDLPEEPPGSPQAGMPELDERTEDPPPCHDSTHSYDMDTHFFSSPLPHLLHPPSSSLLDYPPSHLCSPSAYLYLKAVLAIVLILSTRPLRLSVRLTLRLFY